MTALGMSRTMPKPIRTPTARAGPTMRKADQWMRPFSRVSSQTFRTGAQRLIRPMEVGPGMIAFTMGAAVRLNPSPLEPWTTAPRKIAASTWAIPCASKPGC